MKNAHIHLLSVPVSDQERSKAFYRDVLGFEVIRDNDFMPGSRWIELAPPGSSTHISLVNWFPQMQPGGLTGTVIHTPDIDAEVEALKARGLECGPIESAPWGRYVTFDDPDGNGWVLQTTAM